MFGPRVAVHARQRRVPVVATRDREALVEQLVGHLPNQLATLLVKDREHPTRARATGLPLIGSSGTLADACPRREAVEVVPQQGAQTAAVLSRGSLAQETTGGDLPVDAARLVLVALVALLVAPAGFPTLRPACPSDSSMTARFGSRLRIGEILLTRSREPKRAVIEESDGHAGRSVNGRHGGDEQRDQRNEHEACGFLHGQFSSCCFLGERAARQYRGGLSALLRGTTSTLPPVGRRLRVPLLPVAVLLWLALGSVLAVFTSKVANWFVMTDELLYERLAISIANTHSPLPHVHGEAVSNINQLYPLLIAPAFGT